MNILKIYQILVIKMLENVYVKLAGAHASAEGMRETISRNLDKSFVQRCWFYFRLCSRRYES
mgnify:CR=1 FL=1